MKSMLSKVKNEKGQSAVEFALVAILLFLLLFGIIEFGRAWYRADVLQGAANLGARTCAVTKDPGKAETAARSVIPNNAATTIEIITCTPAAPVSEVTVTVYETFNSNIPIIHQFLNNKTLTRTSTYRGE